MNSIYHRITLKFISFLLISLILIMTSIQIASMLTIKENVLQIENLWDEVQVGRSEKLRLENSMRSYLGYGGMIHKLKNAVINNSPEELEDIKGDLHNVEAIIELYLSFQLSNAERYALNDILEVVKNYQTKINQLSLIFRENAPIKKIDKFIRVDDQPALRALTVIEQNNRHIDKQQAYDQATQTDKFVLLTDIVGQMGYGGLIHNIKNLQLRNDNYYVAEVQNNINQLQLSIAKYYKMPLITEEKQALEILQDTVSQYQIRLENLKQPHSKRKIATAINDKKALQALDILNLRIETELKSKIVNVGEKIHSIQNSINKLIQAIIALCIITLFIFSYIMFKKVILPLQKVTQSMVSLAAEHHNKVMPFHSQHIYEIKQMIRSIRIFKNHQSKRRKSEKSLTKMNITTLKQLDEIKTLQIKSEQKTEQALALANHLIELQKSADIDRKNALASQRRINTILNTVHDTIITTSKEGIIESINTATEKMLGYSAAELINKDITMLMLDEVAIQHKKMLQQYNANPDNNLHSEGREQIIKHADGSTFPVEIFLGQSEINGEIKFTAVIRDITQRKKNEQAIQHLVLTDPLTDLANRRHFNRELQHALDIKQRLQLSVALLMIDLDNFKPINDTFGHNMGDKVLQKVARRLRKITRKVDLIVRLGGDEFAIIINSVHDRFDAITPAKKVVEILSKPMSIDGKTLQVGASVGVSISPQDALSLEDFINHADKALYKAKSLGKGGYFSYQDLSDDEK